MCANNRAVDKHFLKVRVGMGDTRLTKRLVKLADRLGEARSASSPGECNGRAEMRMAELPMVLCLQDTTELDFNGQDIDGLGRRSYDAQRGMYLHPTYVVSPQRLPLGIVDAWM